MYRENAVLNVIRTYNKASGILHSLSPENMEAVDNVLWETDEKVLIRLIETNVSRESARPIQEFLNDVKKRNRILWRTGESNRDLVFGF
jgi:hypothetical protein